MASPCGVCGEKKAVVIYTSLSRIVCQHCYSKELKTKKSLIKKLPRVADRPAPLGYMFFPRDVFVDERAGLAYANALYSNTPNWMEH